MSLCAVLTPFTRKYWLWFQYTTVIFHLLCKITFVKSNYFARTYISVWLLNYLWKELLRGFQNVIAPQHLSNTKKSKGFSRSKMALESVQRWQKQFTIVNRDIPENCRFWAPRTWTWESKGCKVRQSWLSPRDEDGLTEVSRRVWDRLCASSLRSSKSALVIKQPGASF